ncbi:MAG: hypothetical protein REI96_15540 [Flavobacterium nitrogenifigens]|uniref:hypothetical protein n=1 Tax=Flavobacterium nitrogenifigens TaxID=1617283 RepID=UPI0028092DE5|nr:hypothetical protein [Flavobacterium nitrogenifigens]MDQ8013865.1 hypothetical protein [Flavobacterium nitrogenifigens]
MDELGAVFSIILILIIVVTNIIFIRKISRTNNSHYKYKIFFFLISIVSIGSIIIIGALFQNVVLIDYFKITMDIESYQYRIIVMTVLILINIIANFTLLKLYLKRRERKSKNKINEIELIGKE